MPGLIMSGVAGVLAASMAVAAPPVRFQTEGTEQFRYTWRLRGGLAWIASVRFPTSGEGQLTTTYRRDTHPIIETELRITSKGADGFYLYQSQIDETELKTLMTYHGYSWGEKTRQERTFFDYVKRLARIRKQTSAGLEHKVKKIPPREMHDVLTGIYFLRQNAGTISAPVQSEIFSDGKLYPVVYKPTGKETLTVAGNSTPTISYQITAAPGAEKKWPGGVRVWLSDDARRVPVRIEIQRSFATLRLDVTSIQ